MYDEMEIKTNHQSRPLLDWWDLTEKEKKEFDYIDNEEDSMCPPICHILLFPTCRFFRYKGVIYDIKEFQTTETLPRQNPLKNWDGIYPDTFFSGVAIRFTGDFEESVVPATFMY